MQLLCSWNIFKKTTGTIYKKTEASPNYIICGNTRNEATITIYGLFQICCHHVFCNIQNKLLDENSWQSSKLDCALTNIHDDALLLWRLSVCHVYWWPVNELQSTPFTMSTYCDCVVLYGNFTHDLLSHTDTASLTVFITKFMSESSKNKGLKLLQIIVVSSYCTGGLLSRSNDWRQWKTWHNDF